MSECSPPQRLKNYLRSDSSNWGAREIVHYRTVKNEPPLSGTFSFLSFL